MDKIDKDYEELEKCNGDLDFHDRNSLVNYISHEYLSSYNISAEDSRYIKKIGNMYSRLCSARFIQCRYIAEVRYFRFLSTIIECLDTEDIDKFISINTVNEYGRNMVWDIQENEMVTNHDVKAVELAVVRDYLELSHIEDKEKVIKSTKYVHFGLTSEDVNSMALQLYIQGFKEEYIEIVNNIKLSLNKIKDDNINGVFPCFTHGQTATPTTMKHFIKIYTDKIDYVIDKLTKLEHHVKIGGATGNLNGHYVSFPDVDWHKKMDEFAESMNMVRYKTTSQISHYHTLIELCDILIYLSQVIRDIAVDMWIYISKEIFVQKQKQSETGSSTMPHKVNPINFENAEGNSQVAEALLNVIKTAHVSRLFRDLSGSTVLRRLGSAIASVVIACRSLCNGLNSIGLNKVVVEKMMQDNYEVLFEAVQLKLKVNTNIDDPYFLIKSKTRGKGNINRDKYLEIILDLEIGNELKTELLNLTPDKYAKMGDK